jgi:opacity protein-like surface antigen
LLLGGQLELHAASISLGCGPSRSGKGLDSLRSIPLRALPCALLLVCVAARPAHADLTAFIGGQSNPSTRLTRGVSLGTGFLVVGFESEYAQVSGDDECLAIAGAGCAPSVRTLMLNGLVQTPRGIIPGAQLYATVGGGYYRVRFESLDRQETGVGTNVGGGVKISLAGPLRVRLDYRIFQLTDEFESQTGDGAFKKTSHRFYAGANIAF